MGGKGFLFKQTFLKCVNLNYWGREVQPAEIKFVIFQVFFLEVTSILFVFQPKLRILLFTSNTQTFAQMVLSAVDACTTVRAVNKLCCPLLVDVARPAKRAHWKI